MEKQTPTDKEILKVIEDLKNSKTDEEFCECLKRYTTLLSNVGFELEKQKAENKTLRNSNHLLAIELAKQNMQIVSYAKKVNDLQNALEVANEKISNQQEEILQLKNANDSE